MIRSETDTIPHRGLWTASIVLAVLLALVGVSRADLPGDATIPDRGPTDPGKSPFTDVAASPLADTGADRGVAWADYDGDGDLDLYLNDSAAPGGRLFRNDGGGVFADATAGDMLGVTGLSAAWGDHDNDGDPDLYVSDNGANTLLRNDGGGVFSDVTSAPLDDASIGNSAVWGDYDNDGDLDLYLANEGSNRLFRNDGAGAFSDVTGASGPVGGSGISLGTAWGDYDADGDLDLYVANLNTSNRLLRNEGDGSFVDASSSPIDDAGYGRGCAWGDYDNDGDLDLYLTQANEANRLFRNDGGGTFSDVTPAPLADTGNSTAAAWGDSDNDGDLDLFVNNYGAGNRLVRNDGGGVFADATVAPIGDVGGSSGVAFADFDGDGDLDLFVSNNASPSNQLLRNDLGNGNHWLKIDPVGYFSNRDGIGARVRVVTGGASQVREISGGNGYNSQNPVEADFGLGAASVADSVIVRWPSGIVQVLTSVAADQTLQVEETDFTDVTSGPLGDSSNIRGFAWGDYDGDGDLDIYIANESSANVLMRNNGDGVFVDATSGPLGDTGVGRGVAWGDYDNDGDLDLYFANRGSSNRLLRNDGGGAFTDVTSGPLSGPEYGAGVAWGDYDNDGDLDLYLAGDSGDANMLIRNDGGGVFVDATSGPLGDAGSGIDAVWGDYDDDGDLDLYLTNYGSANRLFRNDGGGVFADATGGVLGDAGDGAGAAWGDYDNDGDLDLYLANRTSDNRLYRNDGAGAFVDVAGGLLATAGNSRGVAWGDYDNDGDLDLYVTVHGANKLFRNDGGGSFIDASSGPLANTQGGFGTGWGDYDNDGDLDLYVVNYGTSNVLLRNETSNGNHWLQADLVGVASNASAIGARVRLVADGLSRIREISGGSSYLSQNSLTVEFGLGTAAVADSLIIIWPSGITQILTDVPADQKLTITEDYVENVVIVPDPLEISLADEDGGLYKDTAVVRYLGYASGALFGYSIDVTWDPAVFTAAAGDFSRPDDGAFASAFVFMVQIVSPGVARIDAALSGGSAGTTGDDLFKVTFTAVGAPDYATSDLTLTLNSFRDVDNTPLDWFAADHGEVIVDLVAPVVSGVSIVNDTLGHTDEYLKNDDAITVTATVSDGDPAFGTDDFTADLSGLGGDAAAVADTYAAGSATWVIPTAACTPADGTVTVTVDAVDGLGNASSDSDTIIADNTAPTAVTGLAAAPGHKKVDLTWDDAAAQDTYYAGVVIRYAAWGDYADYATAAPAYPDGPAAGDDAAFDGTGAVATHAFVTDDRDVYYYAAYVYDEARNYSPLEAGSQDRATNYWLGDVGSGAGGPYDGQVTVADYTGLASTYGLADGEGGWKGECDVGPTDDHSRVGIPEPDDAVQFEDLMIFAMNAGVAAAKTFERIGTPEPVLAWERIDERTWSLRLLEPCADLKGVNVAAKLPAGSVTVSRGELLSRQDAPTFLQNIPRDGLDAGLALMGRDLGIVGDGELMRVRTADEVDLTDAVIMARGVDNAYYGSEPTAPDTDAPPARFSLAQNYPNPFNPQTKIVFGLPEDQPVRLTIYTLDGRRVRTLLDEPRPAGVHEAIWNGRDDRGRMVASGTYVYRLQAGPHLETRKMSLMK